LCGYPARFVRAQEGHYPTYIVRLTEAASAVKPEMYSTNPYVDVGRMYSTPFATHRLAGF
jgi:hypothetical protein